MVKKCLLSMMSMLAVCVFSAEAALRITYSVSLESEIVDDKETTNESRSGVQTVLLGKDFIDCSNDDGRRIYDFSKMKILVGESGGTLRQMSIYTDIGFRTIEFFNRMKLSGALAYAGIKENPMERVLTEHLFSMRSDEPAELRRVEDSGGVSFFSGDKKLLTWKGIARQLTDEELKRFILFLRYQYGIHPDILDEFAQQKAIPESMEIVRYNVARKDVYLVEVVSAEAAEDKYLETVGDSLDSTGDGKLISICTKANEIKPGDFDQKNRELVQQAVELAEAEDYLNSTLLFLEYTLSAGESMPSEFFRFKEAATADPNLKLLFASMNPKDEDSATQALIDFEVLKKKVDAGRHVFWIFQANLFTSFDRTEEAKDLFLKTLAENPMIVGAWKDLGQIYHRQFDCGSAWLCWDVGRSIYSGHGLFDGINDLEAKLKADFPEFFLP